MSNIPQRFIVDVDFRYSEFDTLRENLCHTFPNSKAALPKLPPKSALRMNLIHFSKCHYSNSMADKFQTKFIEKRLEGLQYFLKSGLLLLHILFYFHVVFELTFVVV